jgi:hypothetical protein
MPDEEKTKKQHDPETVVPPKPEKKDNDEGRETHPRPHKSA